jgi:hypothetical protein
MTTRQYTYSVLPGSYVWLEAEDLARSQRVGRLRTSSNKGKNVTSLKFSQRSDEFVDQQGVIGEIGLAKLLRLDLDEVFSDANVVGVKSSARGTDGFDLLGFIDVKTVNMREPPSLLGECGALPRRGACGEASRSPLVLEHKGRGARVCNVFALCSIAEGQVGVQAHRRRGLTEPAGSTGRAAHRSCQACFLGLHRQGEAHEKGKPSHSLRAPLLRGPSGGVGARFG